MTEFLFLGELSLVYMLMFILTYTFDMFNVEANFLLYSVIKSILSYQNDIERLKVENDRLKMESRGSGSRAPSQMSISPSSVGLSSQLSLTESTSLGRKDF